MPTELKLKMTLPENFRQACEDMKADPQQVLQLFIDHLLFVSQIATPGHDPASCAGSVLRAFLDTCRVKPVPDFRTREINIRYTQEVINLLRNPMSAAKRQEQYGQIIDSWHNELQLVNN